MKSSFLVLCSLAFLPGCVHCDKLQIGATGGLAAASIQVDVLPDSPAVQSVPISQYFLPGNAIRAASKPRTVRFGAGQPSTQEVATSGLGDRAVIIAQLPGGQSDMPGDADVRRKTIPLSGKLPDGSKVKSVMQVDVSQGGITVKAK